jgi:hypothetical protein
MIPSQTAIWFQKIRRTTNTTIRAIDFLSTTLLASCYGIGSYPPGKNGLHLRIRLMVIQPPRQAPYLETASRPYWEQVG